MGNTESNHEMIQPLNGIRVLAAEQMQSLPYATQMLASLGAEVVKVEHPTRGDLGRSSLPATSDTEGNPVGATFLRNNLYKKSIALDLKHESGQDLFRRLAKGFDVVAENFKAGTMERFGLGYSDLRKHQPKLIYLSISGFGNTVDTPYSEWPAFAPIAEAMSGIYNFNRGDDEEIKVSPVGALGDTGSGLFAVIGVLSALRQRDLTGEGLYVDISMLDSGLFFLFPDGFMNHTLLDDDVEVGKHLADVMYNLTKTQDGGIIISAATEQHIRGALQVAGRDDLIGDPRFTTVVTLIENIEEFMEMIKEEFSNMTSEEAIQKLQEKDVPCAECHNHEEVINQSQIDVSETLLVRNHPLMGSMRIVKSPSRFSGEQSEPGYHCPAHGESTESLLKEWSYTEEQIAEFRQKKVIS